MQTNSKIKIVYDDSIVRLFIWASIAFGIIGMLVGLWVALQLAFPESNFAPYLTFGRLRPLHTNAVIFAFVGNMLFAGIYYSTQRLLKARMASDLLSKIHFWGWQAIILSAAITLPLGITQSKEYAELEWPIDIAVALIWVVFAINFFWTIFKRREKHLYVAIWFYIATILTIAMLYIVNNLAIPVSGMKSYSIFAGVQDALVQWWYGHNAVAFFLTTPILGIMYYFLPKAAERPVFSYRLSIIHFWALVFIYIWAGPHHLLYTALPDWAQSAGMVFSLMLWAPSWGGMLNGLLTLRGAWDKLRDDPVLKFFAAGVTFYGMATFEGPLLSIKSVSGLAHYTDWIIAHVHGGALGWNGFMAAGMFYWLVPRLFNTKLRSTAAANFHFWIGTVGILLYVISMWTAGVEQGLMWRATTEDGGLLYNFVETVVKLKVLYWTRFVGGTLYLVGFLIMTWNLIATAMGGEAVNGEVEVEEKVEMKDTSEPSNARLLLGWPVVVSTIVILLVMLLGLTDVIGSIVVMTVATVITIAAAFAFAIGRKNPHKNWHSILEGKSLAFSLIVFGSVAVGGAAEIIPTLITSNEIASAAIREGKNSPYSALELEGRDIYVQEGCYTCHSQMIRPFTWETKRYGAVSTIEDSIFDHPFQWGSRRIGPDLAREGDKKSNDWHYRHMINPRDVEKDSIMPAYPHLATETVDLEGTPAKLRAMRNIGVPYKPEEIQTSKASAERDGQAIAASLKSALNVPLCSESQVDGCLEANSKLVALIAYLQRLGKPLPVKHSLPGAKTASNAGGQR